MKNDSEYYKMLLKKMLNHVYIHLCYKQLSYSDLKQDYTFSEEYEMEGNI